MSIFDEAETLTDPDAAEPDMKEVDSYHRRTFKGQREELLKDIPHEKKRCTLAEEDRFCETCGTALKSVGEEFVRTEIEFIPARIRVVDYYWEAFECRMCRKKGEPYMEKSPIPYPVIQHSYASASTVAWVIHQTYELAIPLYRQEREWETLGVCLSRGTMANRIMTSHRNWLSPVVELLKQKLLQQHYLYIDETPRIPICGYIVRSKEPNIRSASLNTSLAEAGNTPRHFCHLIKVSSIPMSIKDMKR